MSELTQRMASLDDFKEIWSLFQETAAAVPLDLKEEAAQEGVLNEIMACCTYGIAPIAVQAGKVVGAVLVRRDTFEWGVHNGEAVHIAEVAVAGAQCSTGLLGTLIASIQARAVPVLARVRSGAATGLADALLQRGFILQDGAGSALGDMYVWHPARG